MSYLISEFPDFVFVEDVAFVTLGDFNRLPTYNTTMPTGMYSGKVWKRRDTGDGWLLAEARAPDDDPDASYVNIIWRRIKITAPPSRPS